MKEDTIPFSRFANEDAPLLSHLVIEDGNGATSFDAIAESAAKLLDQQQKSEPTSSPQNEYALKNSLQQTALNIAKMCMGTGTLALPFAAKQGGLLFNVLGLALITLWNIYAVNRLLKCIEYIQKYEEIEGVMSEGDAGNRNGVKINKKLDKKHRRTTSSRRRFFKALTNDRIEINEEMVHGNVQNPPPNTPTFGKVTWYAMGPVGLYFVDIIMLTFMFGIVVSYIDAMIGFIARTPLTMDTKSLNAVVIILIIIPLACIPDLKYISKLSALGIFIIVAIFIIIAGYGVKANGLEGFHKISWGDLWPANLSNISNWFGVVAFGYGVVPFTYNHQESMKEPHQMQKANQIASWIVFVIYIVIADGIVILLSPSNHSFDSDVIAELPNDWIPTLVRISMTIVVLVTCPLIIVPMGDLLEGKLGIGSNISFWWKIILRVFVCSLCATISVMVPDFVYVISFVGCVCVAVLSFVYPPLVHLLCIHKYYECMTSPSSSNLIDGSDECSIGESTIRQMIFADVVLITGGILCTSLTSVLTFRSMMENA